MAVGGQNKMWLVALAASQLGMEVQTPGHHIICCYES